MALKLRLAPKTGASYSADYFPLLVTFENAGEETLRILRHFTPLQVFFSVSLVHSDGTPVILPGGGKIDFARGQLDYIILQPQQTFEHEIHVEQIIPAHERLTPDSYTVSVTYHNQYGEDCAKGMFESNAIVVPVGIAESGP